MANSDSQEECVSSKLSVLELSPKSQSKCCTVQKKRTNCRENAETDQCTCTNNVYIEQKGFHCESDEKADESSAGDSQDVCKNKNSDCVENDLSALREVCNIENDDEKKEKIEDNEESKFDGVFSDTESEGAAESDEEDDNEDLSVGVDDFIASARERHAQRMQGKAVSMSAIGIESCIVGCVTFERSYSKPSEKILLLQLLSIRKRYRKCGIGRYLVNCVRDPTLVGSYDTIVVHADPAAVDFFKTQNFNEDVILNSRFSHLSDLWENSTLMCYLPPFTGSDTKTGAFRGIAEIISMEEEMQKWKERSIEAYQAQMTCMVRLQHEIKTLRAMVETQDEMILTLKLENETTQCEKFTIEKEYLDYRLKNRMSLLMGLNMGEEEEEDSQDDEEKLLAALISSQGKGQITSDFIQSMKKDKIYSEVEVKDIRKTEQKFLEVFQANFDSKMNEWEDSDMCLRLYYCGGSRDQLERILQQGFCENDVTEDVFGKGLYFSQHACKAAQFSVPGLILLARVGLGKVESIIQRKPQRQIAPVGFDSILTPGRESYPPLCATENQEYIVFDCKQAVPLYLIEYNVTRS